MTATRPASISVTEWNTPEALRRMLDWDRPYTDTELDLMAADATVPGWMRVTAERLQELGEIHGRIQRDPQTATTEAVGALRKYDAHRDRRAHEPGYEAADLLATALRDLLAALERAGE